MKQQEKTRKTKGKSKLSKTGKKSSVFSFLLAVLIFIFLFLNILFSQVISPIYFQIANNNRGAVDEMLLKIKGWPEFDKMLAMNVSIYGQTVSTNFFREENKNKTLIDQLEQQLAINPNESNILYNLYKLYLKDGQTKKAADYLKRAKVVDPSIN